jgi:YD repeat-containing protein
VDFPQAVVDPSTAPDGSTSSGSYLNLTTTAYDTTSRVTNTTDFEGRAAAFGYDASGSRTEAGTDSYPYGWRNRLTSTTVGKVTVTHTYAGDDRRATRTVAGATTGHRVARMAEPVDDGTTVYRHTGGGAGVEPTPLSTSTSTNRR